MSKEVIHKAVMLYQGYEYINDHKSPYAKCDSATEGNNVRLHWKKVTCKGCLKHKPKRKV